MDSSIVTDSEFYMWRAVFAFAFADGELSDPEHDLLNDYRGSVQFSPRQLEILKQDFANPQQVEHLFKRITAPEDKHRFCIMARALAWSEGDLDKQEERILKHVSCLGSKEHSDVFKKSRGHPDVLSHVEQYTKSGTMGFLLTPHIVELRA